MNKDAYTQEHYLITRRKHPTKEKYWIEAELVRDLLAFEPYHIDNKFSMLCRAGSKGEALFIGKIHMIDKFDLTPKHDAHALLRRYRRHGFEVKGWNDLETVIETSHNNCETGEEHV